MKNYKAETILNSSSFPELWVSNLQEKHIDLLIERILFFMMDNKELSDLQWGNLIRFLEAIEAKKFYKFFASLAGSNNEQFITYIKKKRLPTSFSSSLLTLNDYFSDVDNQKEHDRLINKIIKRHAEKTARK